MARVSVTGTALNVCDLTYHTAVRPMSEPLIVEVLMFILGIILDLGVVAWVVLYVMGWDQEPKKPEANGS